MQCQLRNREKKLKIVQKDSIPICEWVSGKSNPRRALTAACPEPLQSVLGGRQTLCRIHLDKEFSQSHRKSKSWDEKAQKAHKKKKAHALQSRGTRSHANVLHSFKRQVQDIDSASSLDEHPV
jgi:hypothetical protein